MCVRPKIASVVMTAPLWGSVSNPPDDKDAIRCRISGVIPRGSLICKNVGAKAFNNTKYYNTSKNWYKGQLYISNCVVASKKNIKSVSLKSNTRLIASSSYIENKYIKTLTIPNSVKYINDYAFYDCYKLRKVTLNKSLKKIGDGNFEKSTSESCVLYVYKNSVGHKYAKYYKYNYKIIK